jgi:hypothetical protein
MAGLKSGSGQDVLRGETLALAIGITAILCFVMFLACALTGKIGRCLSNQVALLIGLTWTVF